MNNEQTQQTELSILETLRDMALREEVYFEDLTLEERLALNRKELIEDDFFIMLSHDEIKYNEKIESLIPLNFYVNKNYELVAYNEDRSSLCAELPINTILTFNKI